MNYSIVPASIRHIKALSENMRGRHCAVIRSFGINPRQELRRTFMSSRLCKTALVSGEPVAMWGVQSSLLGGSGVVWLVLTDEITKFPLSVVREARHHLARSARQYDEIVAMIMTDDADSLKFARFLGFSAPESAIVGSDNLLLLELARKD